jgi:diguanylate cyclase (GGDEF)-like protein
LTIAERIRKVVEELEIPYESEPIKLTVCAGIAQLDPEAGWEAMMRRADAAMYESKQHGRNLVSTLSVFRLKNDWAGIRLGKIESLPAARCRYA